MLLIQRIADKQHRGAVLCFILFLFTSFLSHKKEQKGPAPGTFELLAPLARELLRNITRSSLACR